MTTRPTPKQIARDTVDLWPHQWHLLIDTLAEHGYVIVDRATLSLLTDLDPCQYDHNRDCQAHAVFGLDGDDCPHEIARRLLDTPAPPRREMNA